MEERGTNEWIEDKRLNEWKLMHVVYILSNTASLKAVDTTCGFF